MRSWCARTSCATWRPAPTASSAALKGTAEIGLAVAATTFSIVAVFVPVAFMPGVSGEWFRPFGLTVVASVLVSLFISFTLDPMLSAYWGDPPGHAHAPRRGIGRVLAAIQQLVRPPGRSLRPRDRLGAAPPGEDVPAGDRQLRRRDRVARVVRRLELPAAVGRRRGGDRRAHAVVEQPELPQAQGRGRRHAGAHDSGDGGHQHRGQPDRRPRLRRHRQEHQARPVRPRSSRATCAGSRCGWSAPNTPCSRT